MSGLKGIRYFLVCFVLFYCWGLCYIPKVLGRASSPVDNVSMKGWLLDVDEAIPTYDKIAGASSSFADDSIFYCYVDTAILRKEYFSFYHIPEHLVALGNIYSNNGMYGKAIRIYKTGLFFSNGISAKHSSDIVPTLYNNIALAYWWAADYKLAAGHFYLAIEKIESELKDKVALGNAYYNLSDVLFKMKEYKKAVYYLEKARMIAYMEKNEGLLASVLVLLGNIADVGENDKEKAIRYYKQALDCEEAKVSALKNIGSIYIEQHKPEMGIPYLLKALELPRHYYTNIRLEQTLGRAYLLSKQYDQSERYLLSSLSNARRLNIKNEIATSYSLLGELYEKKGELSQALQYQKLYLSLYKQIYTTEKAKTVNMLEVRYRTAQKDQQITSNELLIAKQKTSIWKKNALLISITGTGVTLLLIVVPFYLYKQQLQVKKIQIIQQQQELKIMQAIIEGEEKERSRMARELHDGIGGMLSTTKMYLETIQGKYDVLSDAKDYAEAVQSVNDTLLEVRTSAHNLLPELVLTHGLSEAVRLYCIKVSKAKKIEINFQFYGYLGVTNSSFELSVYRSIQELIQNVLKHARATKALVQISAQDDMLSIAVEDNGIGMNSNDIPDHGVGLSTIKTRMKNMGGQFGIHSLAGKGTSVYLEFDLHQQIISNEYKGIHS